ncbi:MAG: hypothetical protein LBT33_07570 [Spirochaetia bacterium]|nr:hypothetical protein [Spirochaetia bacterium]
MAEFTDGESRPGLRRLVEAGKIDRKTAHRAAEIPEAFLAEFYPLLGGLSFSNTRIFLERLGEVLAGKSPEEAAAIKERLLAARRPEEELARIRMPELTEMEGRFRDITGRILRGSGVSLKAPPYFEGGRFAVAFSFGSAEELRRKIRALEKLAAEGDGLYGLL